jgi:hypothetical protein
MSRAADGPVPGSIARPGIYPAKVGACSIVSGLTETVGSASFSRLRFNARGEAFFYSGGATCKRVVMEACLRVTNAGLGGRRI